MATHSSIRAWRILWSMGSQRVGQDCRNLECLHHSPSQFVCSLPDLPLELHEISSLFQTSFSTFSSGHSYHSRFILNTVLHFQQSTTEAEISLPYLTPKVEQKNPRVLIKIMKIHGILILFLLYHHHFDLSSHH